MVLRTHHLPDQRSIYTVITRCSDKEPLDLRSLISEPDNQTSQSAKSAHKGHKG